MKRVFILPDGMADYNIPSLGGKTPVEYADTPWLDRIVSEGTTGRITTVPAGFPAGSDVCIMSLLGYDPAESYTGRAPLEAASLNVKMGRGDLAYRLNLVNISEAGEVNDHCAGHISTSEALQIISDLKKRYKSDVVDIVSGVSYRHILVLKNSGTEAAEATPPHDIPGEPMESYLPRGANSEKLRELMLDSKEFLKNHPVNISRRQKGKKEASMIWLWGGGTMPAMRSFYDSFSVKGAVLSAVSLVKGIASVINLDVADVPGITGGFDTDYKAKGLWACEAIDNYDFIMVHIESPDEAGHAGDIREKIKAIENIDRFIIKPVYEKLKLLDNVKLLISPDHFTPVEKKIHVSEPVPFTLWGDTVSRDDVAYFSENQITGRVFSFEKGFEIMPWFLK